MTRALVVRQGSRAIVRAASYHPAFRYARYANTARRYGPTAFKYGTKIARFMYNRYKSRKAKKARFSKQHIGHRVGSARTKTRVELNNDFTGLGSRTLRIRGLTFIPKGQLINERERNVVNVRGFKICLAVRNMIAQPVYFNAAVVSVRNDTVVTTSNFFRAQGAERGQNFENSLTGLQMHCLNLNTDKFNILKHRRYRLAPDVNDSSNYQDNKGNSYMNIDWYIKLKRQLRFDDDDQNTPIDSPIYLVYWCDAWTAAAGSTPIGNAVNVQDRHICYFKEPKP